MLKIRLSMGGVRKRPIYKIVIADSRAPRDGRFVEKIGTFNPLLPKDKKERISVEAERVKYWISKGARPTLRVSRILGEAQLMPMPKAGNNPLKAIPKKDRKKEGDKEAPKADAPKAEAAKTEAPKEEAPKADAPKAEAAKTEAPKEEAPKADAPKAEAAKTEAPKEEAPKADAPKAEAAKTEAPKEEAPKAEHQKLKLLKKNKRVSY
jgi:small subunit ribosomal protein S16